MGDLDDEGVELLSIAVVLFYVLKIDSSSRSFSIPSGRW
jgi:hypothetical protein